MTDHGSEEQDRAKTAQDSTEYSGGTECRHGAIGAKEGRRQGFLKRTAPPLWEVAIEVGIRNTPEVIP